MPKDRALRRSVLTELIWEPGIDVAHIDVIADRGIVTIAGCVESLVQRQAVERTIVRVRGVRVVIDQLEVRLPLLLGYGDADASGEIDPPLDRSRFAPRTIRAGAGVGKVPLNGTMPTFCDRDAERQGAWNTGRALDVELSFVVT